MDFIKRIAGTKTFYLGLVLIAVSIAGLLPWLGYGFQPEALFAGLALLTVRDAIAKQDIHQLDAILDRLVGDKISMSVQDVLIAVLVSEGYEPQEATEKAIEITKKLER